MKHFFHLVVPALIALLMWNRSVSAYVQPTTAPVVTVKFASGESDLDTLKTGAKIFTNRKITFGELPPSLDGLTFTRRAGGRIADVTLRAAAGSTIFLLVDSDVGRNSKGRGVAEGIQTLGNAGWSRMDDIKSSDGKLVQLAVLSQSFKSDQELTIHARGFTGVIVAGKSLVLSQPADKKPNKPASPGDDSPVRTDPSPDTTPLAGETVHVASQQASIKSLEIFETDSGLMLGQTSEVTLTAMRGNASRQTSVRFVTQIGDEMSLARDEAMRFIRLTTPNWNVDQAEITFEDKYVPHDGGSIGAAIGTLTMSVIQGFSIDPNAAITGDISANGKVRAIGGLDAKLRGAAAAGCLLVAAPTDNYADLVDSEIYSGIGAVTDTQVIGITSLEDAIATMRADRAKDLAQAIAIFSEVQQSLKQDPAYTTKKEAIDKLTHVLKLAPEHLSAKLLLAMAQKKLPTTLSVNASRYYAFLAARSMVALLLERDASREIKKVPSVTIQTGLADLTKLRSLASPRVLPMVDAWIGFIRACDDFLEGNGSSGEVESQRQALLDELTREQADPQLMQRMLKEGITPDRGDVAQQPGTAPGASTQPTAAGVPPVRNGAAVTHGNVPPGMASDKVVVDLGGQVDQVRTGGGGHFLVFHVKDSDQLSVVDVLAGKIVKQIPVQGDICYCLDQDKLIIILNNQRVMQRWDLATLSREKTVMLPDDRPVKRAAMGSAGSGPLMIWTEGGCQIFDVGSLKPLTVDGDTQKSTGFGPWISADGLTACDWGWSSGPYSLMRLSHLTTTSVDCKLVNTPGSEDYNESWAMPSPDGSQLIRHSAVVYDASTDSLVAFAPGPLKGAVILPTEDPRFLLALRGTDQSDKSSSVSILAAFDRRVLYTVHKTEAVTGGMIETTSGRLGSDPRAHYLPGDNKLVLIPTTNNKVVIYSLDLNAALKTTGADYLYVISKPCTVLSTGQPFDYQIETLSSSGGVKFKLEQSPPGMTVSDTGRVSWKTAQFPESGKVQVVLTISDSSGQEAVHAIELQLLKKSPAPGGSNAQGHQPSANHNKPAPNQSPAKPGDPDIKAIGVKLALKLQKELEADARQGNNNEYTSTFNVSVGKAERSNGNGGPTTNGLLVLGIHEDRAMLVGGDFISLNTRLEIQLRRVDGTWLCDGAISTLESASDSHGPLLDEPRRPHDMTRTVRGLLDDIQSDPVDKPPVPEPGVPAVRRT